MIAGVILVGGKSTRMGCNKALLDFHGIPLVDHMRKLAKQAGCKKVFLSGKLEGYDYLADLKPNLGPVGGIVSAMTQIDLKYTSVLFLPVDMPCVSPHLLQQLLTKSQQDGAHFENQPLPLYLERNPNVIETMKDLRASPSSVHSLRKALNLQELPISETVTHDFVNLNTPELYEKLVT